jgi:glutaryl-CoA dehydrogenase (non-decarboxylating)
MSIGLTPCQQERRELARSFAAAEVAPHAERIDREEATPASVLAALRASPFLGAALPDRWGGGGFDPVSYGVVTEEIAQACSSVRSLLTVHNMSAQAIARFGSPEQQERWLPALCSGQKIIGFALSEPEVGSAVHSIQTEATESQAVYLVNGTKQWVTYGVVADFYLVFARCEGKPVALVIDRETEGLEVTPIRDVFGTRGSMIAQLRFRNACVERDRQLGATGMGTSFVAQTSLDHGRFSVAWGCAGIIQACLDACLSYTERRRQGDGRLRDYQLIRRQLTDMLVAHTAARALCHRCACLRDRRDPRAVMETSLAKYYAAAAAIRVANDAVHLHGANGCSGEYPVSRYLRDATVMGIVEGTHEIHQIALADYAFQRPYVF